MYKRVLSILLLVLLCSCFAVPLGLAQDETPTVAILRFGNTAATGISTTELGILTMLEGWEIISEDDRATLDQRQEFMGENINITWGDAGYDFNNAAQLVESALDADVDVLVTLSTPMTQIAVNATLDMEDPPSVIFGNVFNPREAGIIQSSCIRPAHVSGVEAILSYDRILQDLLLQAPDTQVIGTLFNQAEASGAAGAAAIVAEGEAMGLRVEQAAIASMGDIRVATQGLIEKGVEALVLPNDQSTMGAMPAILTVANDNGVPVYHSILDAVYSGAMVTSGFNLSFSHGLGAGNALIAFMHFDEDAPIKILEDGSAALGVNLDAAAALGIEVNPELVDQAGYIVENGLLDLPIFIERELAPMMTRYMLAEEFFEEQIPSFDSDELENRPTDVGLMSQVSQAFVHILKQPMTRAFFEMGRASYLCTPEMIAEQQAELDAMEG